MATGFHKKKNGHWKALNERGSEYCTKVIYEKNLSITHLLTRFISV